MTTLVTGGAGYIGAHIVRLLRDDGRRVVVVDDLSTGAAGRVAGTELIELDVAAADAAAVMAKAMREHEVSAVVHLAARKQVGQSVEMPIWYYQQNVGGVANVLQAMVDAEVPTLVFSSSAAVYGAPESGYVTETSPTEPINPYGETKLIGEWLVSAAAAAHGLRTTSLRYFNVAGAGWPELGDQGVTNLVPMVLERLTAGEAPRVFGADYPTADGTCIRDYVHVLDLAQAHIVTLDQLATAPAGTERAVNIGTGTGASVLEVLAATRQATGIEIEPQIVGRRPGDPPTLVAATDRAAEVLDWRAKYDLADVARSAWEAWQQR